MKFEPSQIIMSIGWVAVFDDGDEENVQPIVCWALGTGTPTSGKGEMAPVIHGMIASEEGEIVPAKSFPKFSRYEMSTNDEYDIEYELETDVN